MFLILVLTFFEVSAKDLKLLYTTRDGRRVIPMAKGSSTYSHRHNRGQTENLIILERHGQLICKILNIKKN